MRSKDFIEELLVELSIPLVSKSHRSVADAIVQGYRKAAWSSQGFSDFTKKHFPDKPKNTRVLTYLCDLTDTKFCGRCNSILDKKEFSKNKAQKSNLATYCKNCMSSIQKDYYPEYYKENKHKYIEAKLRYYTQLSHALVPWADKDKIREIYRNCPEGYHVDHYYPIQGENICGLHVENNLQYLSSSENISKSNKFPTKPYNGPFFIIG